MRSQNARTGLVESPVLGNGYAGFGRRSGETHRRQRWQGAPGRPYEFDVKVNVTVTFGVSYVKSDDIATMLDALERALVIHRLA